MSLDRNPVHVQAHFGIFVDLEGRHRGHALALRDFPAFIDVAFHKLRAGPFHAHRAERWCTCAARRTPRRVEVHERQAVLDEAVELGRAMSALRPAAGFGERLPALDH